MSTQPAPLVQQSSLWCLASWSPAEPGCLTQPRRGALRSYPTYLKPHTVATWLREARPGEEYILIVDSDMIFRRPLLPGTLGVQPGTAASQNQWCAVSEPGFTAIPRCRLSLSSVKSITSTRGRHCPKLAVYAPKLVGSPRVVTRCVYRRTHC